MATGAFCFSKNWLDDLHENDDQRIERQRFNQRQTRISAS